MTVNRKLLEFLVCPHTKTGLRYDADAQELISDRSKLAYSIKNNVPAMVVEEARIINEKEVRKKSPMTI